MLLERSIGFGHGRLAVIRLSVAVHAGANISPDHWMYCRNAAFLSNDTELHQLFIHAFRVSQEHECRTRSTIPHESAKEAQ